MTKMNYSLSHNRDLAARPSTYDDHLRLKLLKLKKRKGFPAKYDGMCVNCQRPFARLTLISLNPDRKPVHSGGCPKR